MFNYSIKAGTEDVSVVIRIIDSADGTPETGVVFNTSGIDLEYRREGAASTDITEATLAALTTAHSDGGFLHIGNGYYRLDLPDAAVAAGSTGVLVHGTVTGMVVIGCYIQLVAYDPFDTVRLGLTALPNAAAAAAGGLFTRGTGAGQINQDANGRIDVNIAAISGDTTSADNLELYTDGTTPAPVNAIQISGDATAADNAEAFFDGTGYAGTNNVIPTVTVVNGLGANVITAAATAADFTTEIQAGLSTLDAAGVRTAVGLASANLDTQLAAIDDVIDTEVGAIKAVTDKVDTTLQATSDGYAFTANALEETPTSGGSLTAADVWAHATRTLTAIDEDTTTLDLDATIRSAVGLASANLDTQLDALPTAAENATAVWGAGTRSLTVLDEDSTTLDLDATIRAAVGLASANLDTQIAALPTAAENADAVWDEALSVSEHATPGTAGYNMQVAGEILVDTTATGTPSSTVIQLTDGSTVDDFYNDQLMYIAGGTGLGQVRPILDYVGATKTVTVSEAYAVTPDSGDRIVIQTAHVHPIQQIQSGLATSAALATVDGIVDAILVDTNELQTDWADGGRLDLILDARASQTSVDDLPTNAELATALGTADDAVLAQVALVKAVTDKVDTTLEVTSDATYIFTVDALANGPSGSGSSPSAIADEVQTRTIAAVTVVNGLANNVITAAATAADFTTEIQAGLATDAALATVDTVVDAIKVTTDKLDGMVENTSDGWIWTVASLQNGPSGTGLDAAGVRAAVGLASANLDTQLDALPTAIENADALLDRNMATGADNGSTTVRTPRQALRILRNRWSIDSDGLQTITKEDDSTPSWTQQLATDASAQPVTGTDPAGP